MPGRGIPPIIWLFGAATALGCFSTLQAWRLTALSNEHVHLGKLLLLNLAYWYVPAALAFPISRFARVTPMSFGWVRTLSIHTLAALFFSLIDAAAMMGVRWLLYSGLGKPPWVSWWLFAERQYLLQLDRFLMIYVAIIAFTTASRSYARALNAAHLEALLAETRLNSLEARLEPHFLFNTLNAISTLLHTRPAIADRMISRLSNLLRAALEAPQDSYISLKQESELLRTYLEIEQMRFQDRLSVSWEIDPETLDAEVPRMLLQPIVDNVLQQCLSQREHRTVRISSRRELAGLSLQIRVDGPFDDLASPGTGLEITRERLRCLYGSAFTMRVSSGAEGLHTHIRVPFRSSPASQPEFDQASA